MKHKKLLNVSTTFLFASLLAITSFGQSNARSECFPFEKLPPNQRKAAEDLLLKALDSAALYTIVGGLKPMSSGFDSFQIQANIPRMDVLEAEKVLSNLNAKKTELLTIEEKASLSQAKQSAERARLLNRLTETRTILNEWRCGDDLFADVQHFTRIFDGKRYFDAFVMSRPRVGELVVKRADFFSRWGITSNSHPLEILYAVDGDETGARPAGYGFLFGYPDHAVKFFVQSTDEEEFSGRFVVRDFISIPTVARETNNFVYAVPKGHAANDEDTALRAKADPILAAYRKRRQLYIGEGKKGVVEMLRDWFCRADGKCSSINAPLN